MTIQKKRKKRPCWVVQYWFELAIFAVGTVCILSTFFADSYRGNKLDPTLAGQFGDFVGGFIGTFFALMSTVLLFATLRSQRSSSSLQNFETKHFELIKMHRDNVSELEVQGLKGRKIFVALIRELREILKIVKEATVNSNSSLNQKQLIHISYYCLLLGTGPNSTRVLKEALIGFNDDLISQIIRTLDNPYTKSKIQKQRKLTYVPFEGHQSRLGHYYRHLYQSISYVDKQTISIDKYEYIKTIRAQLTTHEQALLLLNSYSPIGGSWWNEKYIVKYSLVKNIPKDFFDCHEELDITHDFPPTYFEWEIARSKTNISR
ncbi:putative phage abortive infection protein [Pseudomonas sp. SWRI81]|uniref:putative phage abortive infection protein n=1 Tax=Pseudomonas sp. SWRI81 TaxID=2745505 RepID=UPI001645524F|nr:putative phage abortive infection protein [Pseudomonas sp. SWRI81]MBC3272174.1 putative phage abortive infection protein [Pseudomonas sp. SWRI81]